MLKRWFSLLLIAMLPILGMAQNGTVYPIDLSVMMTPPYGTCLKEYVGSDRIVIQALLKDMSKTSEQFVIQLRVTDNRNRVVFQSWFGDYEFNPGETFTFPMGPNASPAQKSNVLQDLFNPDHASVRLRNECFDEGAYTFTFQAFERASYPVRKIALSMPFTYPVFLQGNTAQPLQIYPYDNDVICNHAYEYVLDAENNVKKFATQLNGIAYQWQSANPTGMRIGYHLQVVDLGDIEERTKGQIESAAQSAFRNGSFCPVNEIVYTPFYNHNITAGGYNENHAYAWRVRTVTGEELDKAPSYTKENMPSITDNNSPVRVFYFCGAPGIEKDTFKLLIDDRKFNKDLDKVEMDTVKTTGQSANAFWKDSDLKEKYCGVNVEIRKKGQEKWTPFFVEKSDETDAEGKAVDNSHNFENLSYNTRYEVRAQYVDCSGSSCQNRPEGCLYAPYSDVLEFMIPSPIDTAVCGDDLPKLTVCGEGTSVPKILSGDTIIANGAKVVVDEVSYPNASDSSIISGKGHLSMPIVKNIQLKMEFSEIQINCAKELVKGKVKSIWDEQTCAMINLDELTGQGSTGGKDNAPSEASTEEYSEEKAKNSPSGTLLVDEQGNVKFKLKDGTVENIGKSITLSSNEYQSKNYLAENSHYIEFYSTDKVNNAFDNDSAGWYRKMSHYDFFDAPNNKVILPWLANNPGKLKNIKAREVKKKETMASFDSVMFVIPSDAGFIQLKAEKEIVSRGGKNDTVYDLNIPGWADVNHSTPIFAIAKKSDTSSFFDAGKMMVANYAERTHKLNIVSLVGELDNSYKTEAEKALNSIYGKLGVTYEVNLSVFEDETIKDLLSDGLSIGADAESRWKSETSEMKAIRRIYAERNTIDKKAAYLFVVNQPEEEEYKKSVEGDMPRSQSVGYIFKDNVKGGLGRLIAHEIGHGVYKFQHTFDYDDLLEGTTDNLMDYNGGDYLAHYQWKIMQDSVMFVWGIFQDDEDAFFALPPCVYKAIFSTATDQLLDALIGYFFLDDGPDETKKYIESFFTLSKAYDIASNFKDNFVSECLNVYPDDKWMYEFMTFFMSMCECGCKPADELYECLCNEGVDYLSSFVVGLVYDKLFPKEKGNKVALAEKSVKLNKFIKTHFADKNSSIQSLGDMGKLLAKDVITDVLKDFIKEQICHRIFNNKKEEDQIEIKTLSETDKYGYYNLQVISPDEDFKFSSLSLVQQGKDDSISTEFGYKDVREKYNPTYGWVNVPKPEEMDCNVLYYYLDSKDTEYGWTWSTMDYRRHTTGKIMYDYVFKLCKNGDLKQTAHFKTKEKEVQQSYTRGVISELVKIATEDSNSEVVSNNEPKYPILNVDDECSKQYNSNYKYLKNPFGTRTQKSATTFDKSPRKDNESKYDVPALSGWNYADSEHKKYTVSPLSVTDTRVAGLFTVDTENGKTTLNANVAKKYKYSVFKYWGDKYKIIASTGSSKDEVQMMDLDNFVALWTTDNLILSSFTDIYADLMASFNNISAKDVPDMLSELYCKSDGFVEYFRRRACLNNVNNYFLYSKKTANYNLINKYQELLPSEVRNSLGNVSTIDEEKFMKLLQTKSLEQAVSGFLYDLATSMSNIQYVKYPSTSNNQDRDYTLSELHNFYSAYGWLIFNHVDGGLSQSVNPNEQGAIIGRVNDNNYYYFKYLEGYVSYEVPTILMDKFRSHK